MIKRRCQLLIACLLLAVIPNLQAKMIEVDIPDNESNKKIVTPVVRVIMQRTSEGYYIVQDFYKEGGKLTEPFLIKNAKQLKSLAYDQLNIESYFVLWYQNGKKWEEGYYRQGNKAGTWLYWDESYSRNS